MGIITPMTVDWLNSYANSEHSTLYTSDKYQPDDQHNLWIINREFNLLPGTWQRICVTMESSKNMSMELDCCIRLFTETGPYDFPFKIEIK
jgi:hypothetical protein